MKPDLSINMSLEELLSNLTPEELEPRLELQMLLDPISLVANETNNVCAKGGNCNVKSAA